MAQLAESAGLHFQRVTDVRSVSSSTLAQAQVVALFTIGETPWSDEQRSALLDGVRSGRTSILSIHSATDACYGWDDYRLLVGARFDGHPWTTTCTVDVLEPDHPAVAHLGGAWQWHDEVYQFRELRPDARILLAARADELPLGSGPGDAAARPAFGYPLSWCFEEGSGRVFSTSLGHFPHAWESPDYLRHLAGGLDWVTAGVA
jgi:type 1 glutamine amidotransferase